MTNDTDKKTTRSVTLPAFVWEKLRELADRNDRTVNGQIAATLKEALGLVDA